MHILKTLLLSTLLISGLASAETKNGFELSQSLIPANQILQGGPPRDGIPSIDRPDFIPAAQANFLKAKDRIIGIQVNGEARAYPIKILNWHEIVNDTIQGKPVSVTFCPLCGTGIVYEAALGGKTLQFGVSGLLYNSDVLLYGDNADVNAAMAANQIDAALFDLPTALFLSAVMIEGSKVIGQFPADAGDDLDQFGMLFEDGNPLKPCVDDALATMAENGSLAAIEAEWLQDTTGVPLIK